MSRFVPPTSLASSFSPQQGVSLKPPATAAAPALLTSTATGSTVLMVFAAILMVNHMARPFDRILIGLHIPAIICGLSIPAVFVCGGLQGLKSRTGKLLVALIAWMLIISPMSFWRAGSFTYIWDYAVFWLMLFLAIAMGPPNLKTLTRLVAILSVACFISIVWASVSSGGAGLQGDRLAGNDVTYGNPDDFALLIGFALPFCLFFVTNFKNEVVRAILTGSVGLFMVTALVRTGTRCAVLGLGAMAVVLLIRTSMVTRFLLVIGMVIATIIVVATVPATVLGRLATTLDAIDSDKIMRGAGSSEAMASAADRRDLLFDAIKMTVLHPIFGVGPGQYNGYRYNRIVDVAGQRKRWFPAHNTYLQLFAECGFVGGILYIAFLWSIYRTIRVIRRLNRPESHPSWHLIDRAALCLELGLVFFAVCAAFLNCDHYPHQFIIAGFAVALERITRQELARVSTGVSAPAAFQPTFIPGKILGHGGRPAPRLS